MTSLSLIRSPGAYNPFGRVSDRDSAVFFRCLATLLDSGVDIISSLDLLARQSENSLLARACVQMSRRVQSGTYLSVAMTRFPEVFTLMQQRLVQIGERTASIGQVCNRLALYQEQRTQLTQKVRTSLITPLLVSSLCLVLVILLPPFLFRGLFEMLQQSHTPLPWPSQILIAVSSLLRSWLFYAVMTCVLAGVIRLVQLKREDPAWKLLVYEKLMTVPLLHKLLQLLAVTRFLQTLEMTVRVGLPILSSLELAGLACDHPVFELGLKEARNCIEKGAEIHEALEFTSLFPANVVQSVKAGEHSGRLAEMVESLNRLYSVELEAGLESFSQALEPIVLCGIGLTVGFTIIASLLPMVRLLQTL